MDNFRFKDRFDAGRQLAQILLPYKDKCPLILALPRGGVPVGYEVAKALNAPLDTLVARKIGAPFSPELGVGAIAPGDVIILDNQTINTLGIIRKSLDPIIENEMEEMDRRMVHYKSGAYSRGSYDTVIIVDDGLATGVTARAAIESALIQTKPMKLIFAAPICARQTAEALDDIVRVECLQTVDDLLAVGYWYEHFPQTSDEEVLKLLDMAKAR